jgi:hypothetical protein
MMVFWWCNRGGLRGERGVLGDGFPELKNTPRLLNFSVEIVFYWLAYANTGSLGVICRGRDTP